MSNLTFDGNKIINRINARINALENLISIDYTKESEFKIKIKELMTMKEELLSGEFNIQVW